MKNIDLLTSNSHLLHSEVHKLLISVVLPVWLHLDNSPTAESGSLNSPLGAVHKLHHVEGGKGGGRGYQPV